MQKQCACLLNAFLIPYSIAFKCVSSNAFVTALFLWFTLSHKRAIYPFSSHRTAPRLDTLLNIMSGGNAVITYKSLDIDSLTLTVPEKNRGKYVSYLGHKGRP